MVKVSVEVHQGAVRFSVAVRARNIRRAVSFVEERYPENDVQVRFPIDPEDFSVKSPAAQAGIAGFKQAAGLAA